MMLNELFQLHRTAKPSETARNASLLAREAQTEIHHLLRRERDLEQQVERLTLAAMAMAELLRDRLGISQEDIEAKVREIDLRDGQLDGKLRPSAKQCGVCNRVGGPGRRECIYCGAELAEESFLFAESAAADSDGQIGTMPDAAT
jgi:hypothetical protein